MAAPPHPLLAFHRHGGQSRGRLWWKHSNSIHQAPRHRRKRLRLFNDGRKGVSLVFFFFFPFSCDYSYIVLCRYLTCYMDCFVNISYLIMIHFEFLLLFIDCFAFYCL
ncbi:hypothetical protein NC653_019321 [Populus alba x Populus x berolinensis]|uniref:Uncharacterized protein n=1 Tax=Populus alba x Populus x berolinensis TaxID=444605 RepID=A0AAD6VX46_9ROSI|nr:hypothetical protein NC653_019321 [Populus alba x Populus x berolinensis]